MLRGGDHSATRTVRLGSDITMFTGAAAQRRTGSHRGIGLGGGVSHAGCASCGGGGGVGYLAYKSNQLGAGPTIQIAAQTGGCPGAPRCSGRGAESAVGRVARKESAESRICVISCEVHAHLAIAESKQLRVENARALAQSYGHVAYT